MTKKREVPDAEELAVAPEEQNGSPSPPTTEVPEEGAPPYPPEDAVAVPVAAPVWEGGDPGTAVPSADDQDDTYYHPEGEAPPADPDTDGDLIPDSIDDDDDGDGILDVDEVVTRKGKDTGDII